MNRKVIYINSADRDIGGTNENFTITRVVQEFPLPPQSAKLLTASIPYTWNNVTASNNTFSIDEVGTGTFAFTIPAGNYTGATLATAVQAAINNSGDFPQSYTVAFNSTTLQYTFTTGPSGFQIIFAGTGSAAALLGFSPGTTNPGSPATTVTSTTTAQLLPDNELFICSDLVQGSDNGVILWSPTYTPTATNQTQILARVPLTACYPALMNYCANSQLPFYVVSQSNFAKPYTPTNPITVRFFLSFPSGLPISLNGYSWSAEIALDFNTA